MVEVPVSHDDWEKFTTMTRRERGWWIGRMRTRGCPMVIRVPPQGHACCPRGDERGVCRSAPAAQSLPAVGEAPAERTPRRASPLDRVRACPQATAAAVAALVRQRDQFDPFALAARVDQQLARLYTLANHTRAVPATTEGGAPAQAQNACATASPSRLNTPVPSVTPVLARRSAVR